MVRQKQFLRGQITIIQTNQEQSECPQMGSFSQQTVSTEIIQFVIRVTGRESKPKVSQIHSMQQKGNPKGEVDICSVVQKQLVQTKQNTESEIKCQGYTKRVKLGDYTDKRWKERHRVHFHLAKNHGKTGI